MIRFCLFLLLAIGPLFRLSAQIYTSHVYLFTLTKTEEAKVRLSEPKMLTAFNPIGYNNQPSWVSNEELYLTVRTLKDTSQTDIYALNLTNGTKMRLTATKESEYSPMLTPNPFYFSAVRVESDADRTQRLWQFPVDRIEKGAPVFPTIRNIGYYLWINQRNVLLYIDSNPSLLFIAKTTDGSYKKITSDIGRCFQRISTDKVAFVKKDAPNKWTLCELDLKDPEFGFKTITGTLDGSEDFAILPDGTFLMGNASKLYRYDRTKNDEGWVEIADLRTYNIKSITRLAVSPDGGKLALVGQ
ncbi:MAG: hypothetical protein H6563_06990 [Lewinellaceae bacterium]|nr:hypothetical protein [Lewinellaceae bacterium]